MTTTSGFRKKEYLTLCSLSSISSNLVFRLFIPGQTVIVYAAVIVVYLLFAILLSYLFIFFSRR